MEREERELSREDKYKKSFNRDERDFEKKSRENTNKTFDNRQEIDSKYEKQILDSYSSDATTQIRLRNRIYKAWEKDVKAEKERFKKESAELKKAQEKKNNALKKQFSSPAVHDRKDMASDLIKEERRYQRARDKIDTKTEVKVNKLNEAFERSKQNGGYSSKKLYQKASQRNWEAIKKVRKKGRDTQKDLKNSHRERQSKILKRYGLSRNDSESTRIAFSGRYADEYNSGYASEMDHFLSKHQANSGKIDTRAAKDGLINMAKRENLSRSDQKFIIARFDEHIKNLENNGAKRGFFSRNLKLSQKQTKAVDSFNQKKEAREKAWEDKRVGQREAWNRGKEQQRIDKTAPDKRFARIVQQSSEERFVYDPKQDKTGKSKTNEQFLGRLSKNKTFKKTGIKENSDKTYTIDRQKALLAIDKYRANDPSNVGHDNEKLNKTFLYHGELQKNGSIEVKPSELLKDRKQARFYTNTVNQLENAVRDQDSGVSQNLKGNYVLHKDAVVSRGLDRRPATKLSGAEIESKYKGLTENVDRKNLNIGQVKIVGKNGQSPLRQDISENTEKTYQRILDKQQQIPIESLPKHLEERANEVARPTWWKDHVVARREVRAAELQAYDSGEIQQAKALTDIRKKIEDQDYQGLRTAPEAEKWVKERDNFTEKGYQELVDNLQKKGDQEAKDAIVIARHTGVRPEELHQNGVTFEKIDGDTVAVHIEGVKKRRGIEGEARFKADTGSDRTLVIKSEELAEVADRNNNSFKPSSSKDALRMRINRTANEGQHSAGISSYSFRHNICTEISSHNDRKTAASVMGHKSEATQDHYGRASSQADSRIIGATNG